MYNGTAGGIVAQINFPLAHLASFQREFESRFLLSQVILGPSAFCNVMISLKHRFLAVRLRGQDPEGLDNEVSAVLADLSQLAFPSALTLQNCVNLGDSFRMGRFQQVMTALSNCLFPGVAV